MSIQKQSLEEIYSIISSIPKGARGVFGVATETKKKALKKSKLTKAATPEHLAEVKVVFEGTSTLGIDYQDAVNATLDREGKPADFVSQGTYCRPVSENLLIWEYSGKNPELQGKLYFRMYIDYMATGGNFRYFDAKGNEMSQAQYEAWKAEYFTEKKDEGANQGTEKVVKPRNYSADAVLYLKRSEVWLDRREESEHLAA